MQNLKTLTARLLTTCVSRPATYQLSRLWTACRLTQDQNISTLSRCTAIQPIRTGALGSCRYCSSANNYLVKMANLDFKVTEQHIIDFLKDVDVAGGCAGVDIMKLSNGLRSGVAFVRLASQTDLEKALNLEHATLNQRNVYVSRSNEEWLSEYCKKSRSEPHQSLTGHTIDFRRVPDDTTDEMLANFLTPIKPVAIKIFKAYNRANNWEMMKATVDLATHSDVLEAMKKDGQSMDGMLVKLYPVSYDGVCTGYSESKPTSEPSTY